MPIVKHTCPYCGGKMKVINLTDGIKMLECKACEIEVHFKSWKAQEKFTKPSKK